VESRELLRLARLPLFPELAREIAERKLLRCRLSVNGFRGFFCSGGRLTPLFGFYALAIVWSQDAGTAQVFFRVDVLGRLLLIFFTLALLAGCFGSILSLAVCHAEKSARQKQEGKHEEAIATRQIPKICGARPYRG
jgi:hypothetical protein